MFGRVDKTNVKKGMSVFPPPELLFLACDRGDPSITLPQPKARPGIVLAEGPKQEWFGDTYIKWAAFILRHSGGRLPERSFFAAPDRKDDAVQQADLRLRLRVQKVTGFGRCLALSEQVVLGGDGLGTPNQDQARTCYPVSHRLSCA